MISTFFKLAWRNIVKHKTFSIINIIGLAIGLACFLMIAMYVVDELSYDRHHEKGDRIYRVDADIRFGGTDSKLAVSSDPMGATLKKDYPEVEQFVRLYASSGGRQVKKGNEFINEQHICYADSTVFDVFTLPAVDGNTSHALDEPNTAVISESAALKYFGNTHVTGKMIEVQEDEILPYKITAVIKDMPENSHFRFDFLFSMDNVRNYDFGNFLSHNFHTYILLKPGADPAVFKKHFAQVLEKYIVPQASQFMQIKSMKEFEQSGNKLVYSLMPLFDIHLKSDRNPELSPPSNMQYVYIFSAAACLILLLACVNFINLSTANSGSRSREIGIRKVMGSGRTSLIRQFLSESLLTALLSAVVALLLVWASISFFNTLSGKHFSITDLLQPVYLFCILLLALLVGLVAGSYPAFYISSFQPIAALKGKLRLSSSKSYLRNGLVIFQFFIATVLIMGTIVVYKQINFIQHTKLGFNKEQILIVDDSYVLGKSTHAFMENIKKMKGVQMAAQAGYLPVSNSSRNDNTFSTDATMTPSNSLNMQIWKIDYDYIPLLGMEMVQGRNFSREYGTDSTGIIINETCAKMMGGGNVIGRKLYTADDNSGEMKIVKTVVGVVKDFHFNSLRQNIEPLSMRLGNANWSLAFKVSTNDLMPLVASIEKEFKQMAAGKPFSYRFLDDSFDDMYRVEQRVGNLALAFAIIAIAIACMGLFGLAIYMAQQRVKEIGVRKVLGATVSNIVSMLSADFVKLVAIASVIAFPVAWYAMHRWLQDFAYRTTISWWVFVLAAAIGLGIALLTVSFQAIKAALTNPVKSLRTE
jgi:putative ABC transport system permease protein